MLEQEKFQKTLEAALLQVRTRNPGYSLRAFSRKLGIRPSALSEILNGKRRVSPEMAERICDRLNLGPLEREEVLSSFGRRSDSTASRKTLELAADEFHVVSDWYYFAILSLSETQGFRGSPEFVARRLNISRLQAREALRRLERLQLLKRNPKGELVPTGREFSSRDGVPDLSVRKNHAQGIELSRRAIEEGAFEMTDFIGTTLTFDPEHLPAAKKMIRKFRDQFCTAMEAAPRREVYRLNIQLIPLSKRKKS